MTQSDFLRLMVEAGYNPDLPHPDCYGGFGWTAVHRAFIKALRTAERRGWERCREAAVDAVGHYNNGFEDAWQRLRALPYQAAQDDLPQPYDRKDWFHIGGYQWEHKPTGKVYIGQKTSWGGTLPPGAPAE